MNERPRITLRVSVTDRCNQRCLYCRPAEDTDPCGGEKPISFAAIAALATGLNQRFGLTKIRITGGEPLLRPKLENLIAMLAETGVPELALTTNGLFLEKKAAALKRAGLHRINISLDSLSPDTYRQMGRGGELDDALRGLDAALAAGLTPLKINTVVVRGVNDTEVTDLLDLALSKNCELRFIELMPIGPGTELFKDGFVSSEDVRRQLTARFELQPTAGEPGASARRYQVRDGRGRRGTVGFISSCSMPFCAGCTRLRLTADGHLLGCLTRNGGVSVRRLLQNGDAAGIDNIVEELLRDKRAGRPFEQKMLMASIGG